MWTDFHLFHFSVKFNNNNEVSVKLGEKNNSRNTYFLLKKNS